jgi:hypothetical protein
MPRSERLVNLSWRLVLMALIALGGLLSLFSSYQGLLSLMTGHVAGAAALAAGVALAAAVYLMCRHRNDLVCS